MANTEVKKGIESLKASILHDTERKENCFNPNGCDKTGQIKCNHRYCDKYKWIIERATHYAEKLGVTVEAVLESWETDRNYWYMNFYQDSQQPLIGGDDNVRVFDTPEQFRESITKKEFRCPKCEKVSTDEQECTQNDCDWKAYGLFRTLGKGVTVLTKNPIMKAHFFMPIDWENSAQPEAANQ